MLVPRSLASTAEMLREGSVGRAAASAASSGSEAQQQGPPTGGEDGVPQDLVPSLLSAMIWAALVALVAIFYYREKIHPPKVRSSEGELPERSLFDEGEWRFGLFDCFDEPLLCCFSVFCGPIRWADTMRMADFWTFSGALTLFVGLVVLDTVCVGVASLVLLAGLVYYRQRIRRTFGIPSGTLGSYATDCLAYCLCTCCAITQEARQMEEAFQLGHEAVMGPPRQ